MEVNSSSSQDFFASGPFTFMLGELAISRVLIIPNGTLLARYSMVALSFAARVRPCGGLS